MTIGRVTGLYRYPVKSMIGETLEQVSLGERGIPGDRAWAVRDEQRGGIRGGKRFPELMQARARYLEPPPAEGSISAEVELPDGRRFAIDAAEAPGAISELVGGQVSVWPLLPAENLEHYRRGEPITDDMEEELRRIFGRTADEPLPDLSVFPELLMTYESPPGTYFDAFPLLIMTRNGLEHLQRLAQQEASADHQFDVRRFRPNILLDIDGEESFPRERMGGSQPAHRRGDPADGDRLSALLDDHARLRRSTQRSRHHAQPGQERRRQSRHLCLGAGVRHHFRRR